MTQKHLIAGGLLVGSLVLGFAGQAEAASIVNMYDVTQYKNNDHAFTFQGLFDQGLTADRDFQFNEPGKMTVYDDGTATMTGILSRQGSEEAHWNVDLKFNLIQGYDGGLKNPTNKSGVDNDYAYENWSFWEFAEGSVLTGMGDYEGSEIFLQRLDLNYMGQLGMGANDKNSKLGFSSWYKYTGTLVYEGEEKSLGSTKSDINVNLTEIAIPETAAVPEPATMSLMSLGMMGLGASVLKRKKQS